MEDITKLKVSELRHELQIRGLDTKGLKPVLIDRLQISMKEDPANDGEENSPAIEESSEVEAVEEQPEDSSDESESSNKIETVAEITPQRNRSPRKMGSPQKSDNFPVTVTSPRRESVEKLESPQKNETPTKIESPQKTETPTKMESPQKTETPTKIGSSQKVETPTKIESPQKVETPTKFQSPLKEDSPQKSESPMKTEISPEKQSPQKSASPMKEETVEEEPMEAESKSVSEGETEVTDLPESNGVLDNSHVADSNKEASESMDTSDVKDVKEESAIEGDDEKSRRGEKRSRSPNGERGKRHRPDIEEVRQENEPEFDKTLVVLDWYSSDLSLLIEPTRLEATPMHKEGFAYLWHSAKATYGINKGKVCFELKVIDHMDVSHLEGEEHPHVIRVGWSFDLAGLILGEEKFSWGFGGTGKASTQSNFKNYGKAFGKGDVIGCFLDLESDPSIISYTINGEDFGTCFELPREDIQDAGIFPHIMTKNCSFKVNFGDEEPSFELLEGFEFIGKLPIEDRMMAVQGPEKKENAEVIMMVGLPASGKTTWAENYLREHPEKKFNILGTNNLIDRMKVLGLPRRRNYAGRWDFLIDKCTKALNKLMYIAYKRRRNYIIDQTNVYPSAQRRKMQGFQGFQRRAVVVCPSDEELKKRAEKRDSEEGKDVPERAVLEMKGNYKFPKTGESFDIVEFVEMNKEDGETLLQKYNKEGENAGYGPKRNSRGHRRGGSGGDRRGHYRGGQGGGGGGGGGYRGNWDRERDRKNNFDRRDRGSWHRDNRDYRSGGSVATGGGGGGGGNYNRDNRSGGAGGYKERSFNRDRQSRSNSGGGWQSGGSGYRNQNQSSGSSSGYNQGGWNNNQQQQWGSSNQGWGGTGQGYNSGYNWNQQYYGQQQQQQQPQQQTSTQSNTQQSPQQYWTNQGYGSQQQSGYNNAAVGYGTQSYGTSGAYNYTNTQQTPVTPQAQQQQWSGYGTNYNQSYGSNQNQSQNSGYNRNK